jgi:Cu/Ag efflux pump CusA
MQSIITALLIALSLMAAFIALEFNSATKNMAAHGGNSYRAYND